MMCWKKILCLSLLLQICFLLFALTASAAHLSGEWQYREAWQDASELQIVQSAAQGARDWKSFAFPASPPFAEGAQTLYETTQVLPGGDEDTLLFFTTGEKVRVFLDEKLVYTYDETALNSAGGGRMWHLVHLCRRLRIPMRLRWHSRAGIRICSASIERFLWGRNSGRRSGSSSLT